MWGGISFAPPSDKLGGVNFVPEEGKVVNKTKNGLLQLVSLLFGGQKRKEEAAENG